MGIPLLTRSDGHGLVERTGILVGQADIGARHRDRLCLRIRGGRAAIPGADRRAWAIAGAALSGPELVHPNAERLPPALLRSVFRESRMVGGGVGGRDGRGTGRGGAALDGGVAVAAAMGCVPVDRQRRPDLVLVRLGVADAGNRFPGNLSRQRPDRAAAADDVARPGAAFSPRVRPRPDQTSRRYLLAGSDLPVLPP